MMVGDRLYRQFKLNASESSVLGKSRANQCFRMILLERLAVLSATSFNQASELVVFLLLPLKDVLNTRDPRIFSSSPNTVHGLVLRGSGQTGYTHGLFDGNGSHLDLALLQGQKSPFRL